MLLSHRGHNILQASKLILNIITLLDLVGIIYILLTLHE